MMNLLFNEFLLLSLILGTTRILFAEDDEEVQIRLTQQEYTDEPNDTNYTRAQYQPRHVHLSYGSKLLSCLKL